MVRNLARQPEKESELSMIEKAANLWRGHIDAVQKKLQRMERRAAAEATATHLREQSIARGLTEQLAERLPGLSATLRRHGDRIA